VGEVEEDEPVEVFKLDGEAGPAVGIGSSEVAES